MTKISINREILPFFIYGGVLVTLILFMYKSVLEYERDNYISDTIIELPVQNYTVVDITMEDKSVIFLGNRDSLMAVKEVYLEYPVKYSTIKVIYEGSDLEYAKEVFQKHKSFTPIEKNNE